MNLSQFPQLGRPVAYYPSLANKIGAKAAILACQFCYWRGKETNDQLWIWKTRAQLTDETGLTRHEQDSARRTLKRLRIVEEKRDYLRHTIGFRVRVGALLALFGPASTQDQYKEYLKSDHWKSLRAEKLLLNPACQICGTKTSPHVHHVIYRNPWTDCTASDLMTLCKPHHKEVHGIE